MTYKVTCPKCRRVQYAPHCGDRDCFHCESEKPPKGNKYQVWTADGEGLSCPYCGFTAGGSYWEDRDIHGFLKSEGVGSFAELSAKRADK